jgi:hypothetical protein
MKLFQFWKKLFEINFFDKKSNLYSCNRHLSKLIFKLKLNAWNTKFSQNVVCVCSQQISVQHLFFECPFLLNLYAEKSLTMNNFDISSVFENEIIVEIVKIISSSPVCSLLQFFLRTLLFMRVYVCMAACASNHLYCERR